MVDLYCVECWNTLASLAVEKDFLHQAGAEEEEGGEEGNQSSEAEEVEEPLNSMD